MYDPQSKLAAQSLSAGYSADAIIKDLDLELPGGSITAVVGANGAGKSSLLKALARKIKASSGAVLLDGVSITSLTKAQVEGSIGFLGTIPATKNNDQLTRRSWSQGSEGALECIGRMSIIKEYPRTFRRTDGLNATDHGRNLLCRFNNVMSRDTKTLHNCNSNPEVESIEFATKPTGDPPFTERCFQPKNQWALLNDVDENVG